MHFWRSKFAKTGKNDEARHALFFYYGLLSNDHVKRESSSSKKADQLLNLDLGKIKKKKQPNGISSFLTVHH